MWSMSPQLERVYMSEEYSNWSCWCFRRQVTDVGCRQEEVVEGCELAAGGATPLFASLAQLAGRPTAPVDDIESLWCPAESRTIRAVDG